MAGEEAPERTVAVLSGGDEGRWWSPSVRCCRWMKGGGEKERNLDGKEKEERNLCLLLFSFLPLSVMHKKRKEEKQIWKIAAHSPSVHMYSSTHSLREGARDPFSAFVVKLVE